MCKLNHVFKRVSRFLSRWMGEQRRCQNGRRLICEGEANHKFYCRWNEQKKQGQRQWKKLVPHQDVARSNRVLPRHYSSKTRAAAPRKGSCPAQNLRLSSTLATEEGWVGVRRTPPRKRSCRANCPEGQWLPRSRYPDYPKHYESHYQVCACVCVCVCAL